MLSIILLGIVFSVIIMIEAPKLIRRKYWKDLMAFLFFLLLGFTLTVLIVLGINIPSPLKGINFLIEDILGLGYKKT